jgi:serine/threonine protein kinase
MEGVPFNERFVANIFYEIIISIAVCHDQKICHRDLKLENVLINDQNKIKIIDFGAASVVNPAKGLKGKSGTLYYLAPEIAA